LYNTIIIGGGASGLFLGANLKTQNNLLLEGTKSLGSKILISGGGMCNLTNTDSPEAFLRAFGGKNKENFLKPAILNFPPSKTKDFFNNIGLKLITREDGKIFPETLKAISVVDVLARESQKNLTIFTLSRVKKVIRENQGFTVTTENNQYKCKNLVISTGGLSFPQTGSDGTGLNLAKELGHNIITPTPALTGLIVENYTFNSISGNSVKNCQIDFFHKGENKRYLRANGDLLFTHRGFSGPVILNNSRFIKENDTLCLSLVPCDNREEKRQEIINIAKSMQNAGSIKILRELGVPKSLASLLAQEELSTPNPSKIAKVLLETTITVKNKIGFNAAMATAGGVDLGEINRKNMESKLVPNLFFTGEVLDIDGNTGGYNIQAAFSTAKLVADHLNNSI
jgi:predicted Rossmann fold flavoprotein